MSKFIIMMLLLSLMFIGCGVNKDYVAQQITDSEARTQTQIDAVGDKTLRHKEEEDGRDQGETHENQNKPRSETVAENPPLPLVKEFDGVPREEEQENRQKEDVEINEEIDEKVAPPGIEFLQGAVPSTEKEDQTDQEKDDPDGDPPVLVLTDLSGKEPHPPDLLSR